MHPRHQWEVGLQIPEAAILHQGRAHARGQKAIVAAICVHADDGNTTISMSASAGTACIILGLVRLQSLQVASAQSFLASDLHTALAQAITLLEIPVAAH